ncbi:MAG: phosphotransferase, partial [Chloroflexota bacterium]|nr:phosphotransferase [Chloroflexota bacterium]
MEGLEGRVALLLGARPTEWRRRSAPWQPSDAVAGGNDRFTVQLDDGRRVFVKAAKAPHLARWLRREAEVYAHLRGAFIPELIAFEDDPIEPVLVIEDLSDADWDVRWDAARVAAVRAAIAELASSPPPPNTPPAREIIAEFKTWQSVEDDPEPFLSTGIRSREWLERALPVLKTAADRARVDGDDLLHFDVRSDNL